MAYIIIKRITGLLDHYHLVHVWRTSEKDQHTICYVPVPTYTGSDGGPVPARVCAVTVMQYWTESSSRPGTETDCEASWLEGGTGRETDSTSSPVEFTLTCGGRREREMQQT